MSGVGCSIYGTACRDPVMHEILFEMWIWLYIPLFTDKVSRFTGSAAVQTCTNTSNWDRTTSWKPHWWHSSWCPAHFILIGQEAPRPVSICSGNNSVCKSLDRHSPFNYYHYVNAEWWSSLSLKFCLTIVRSPACDIETCRFFANSHSVLSHIFYSLIPNAQLPCFLGW